MEGMIFKSSYDFMDLVIGKINLRSVERFRIYLVSMLFFSGYVIYEVLSSNSFDFIFAYNFILAIGGYGMLHEEHKKYLFDFLLVQLFFVGLDHVYKLEYYEFVLLGNIVSAFNYLLIYQQVLRDKIINCKLIYQFFSLVSFCFLCVLTILDIEILWFLLFGEMVISFVNYSVLGIQIGVLVITLMTLVISFSRHPSTTVERNLVNHVSSNLLWQEENIDNDNALVQLITNFFKRENSYLSVDFSLRKLAMVLEVDNTALVTATLNKKMNTSFYLILSKYRILSAIRMMEEDPERTVVSISKSCGFKSVSTFNKYFNLYIGMTPTEYKDQLLA